MNLHNKGAAKYISLFALLVIAAAIIITLASNRAPADKPALFETEAEYVSGIDISSHNGEIEWDKVAENTDFAIIRAGYRGYGSGEIAEDKLFKENIKAAEKENIPIGVYFYSQAITEAEAQEEADFVLQALKKYDIALPVFIDFEYAHDENGELTGRLYTADLSKKEAANIINAFCSRINEGGKYAGVYSSSSIFNFNIASSHINKNAYIWVADYNEAVTYLGKYDIWQYTKHGSCAGVNSKYVDANYWFINK